MITFIRLFAIIFFLSLMPSSYGQTTAPKAAESFSSVLAQVDTIANAIEGASQSDKMLVDLAVRTDALEQSLIAQGVKLSNQLTEVKSKITQLGALPAEGEAPEPDIVTEQRKQLAEQRATINQDLSTLEDASIRLKDVLDRISEARRILFTDSLSRRYDISGAFSSELYADWASRWDLLDRRITSWVNFTWRFKQGVFLEALGLILLLAGIGIFAGKRFFHEWIYRDPAITSPSYFTRLTTAFWYTVLPSAMLWFFFVLSFGILNYLGVLRDDIAEILQSVLLTIGIVFLIWRLIKGVLAPSRPNWRLLEVSSPSARSLQAILLMMVLVSAGDVLVTEINSIIGTSVPITVARSLITSIVVGVLLVMIAFIRPFLSEATPDAEQVGRPWPRFVRVTLWIIGFGLIFSAIAGYIGLARFVAQQIVVMGAVIATMYLGYRTANAISDERALLETSLGRKLLTTYKMSETTVDRIGLLAGLTLNGVILTIGLPIMALLWGFKVADVQRFVFRFFTNIQVGSISISLASILIGMLLFAVGLFVTRRFQHWLDGKVLSRSGVDAGARNSIRTAAGYVGIAIAGLLGVSAAGLQLSQLALVAGALSLGIGFGLQNIVSNFVSGLILLAERPFKSGDIIEAGAFTGVVKNIKVRATEIETFDKKTLILPNSELINSAVVNWVHKTSLGRVEIPVGVSYDCDPRQVQAMLLEIADDHPRVLANPEPFVEFANFGDSSLDFILRAYIADIGFGVAVRTELRMAIFERFKAAGIEIPFPQRDVNLKIHDGKATEVITSAVPEISGVIKTTKKGGVLEE